MPRKKPAAEGPNQSSLPPSPSLLEIDADRMVRLVILACLGVELLLVLGDYFINFLEMVKVNAFQRLWNIAREDSLAGWFSSIQTLLAALVLWAILILRRAQQAARGEKIGWGVLAAFFTFMAADDGASIHERLGPTIRAALAGEPDAGSLHALLQRTSEAFPSYTWQLFIAPLFVAMGVFLLVFLWRQFSRPSSRRLLLLALACLAAAVALDFIEGLDEAHPWNIYSRLRDAYALEDYTAPHFGKAIEETLEMVAFTLFLGTFLRQLASYANDGVLLAFRFRQR